MYDEIETNIDIERIQKEYYDLIEKFPLKNGQICLTHSVDSTDTFYDGCGSLHYEGDFSKGEQTLRKTFLYEKDFCIFNDTLKDTYFYDVYKLWQEKFNIGRLRLLCLKQKQCLTWHLDNTRRIHLPIITDEKCKFVLEDRVFHLPSNGNSFVVDTKKYHTVFNGSKIWRVHLVGSII